MLNCCDINATKAPIKNVCSRVSVPKKLLETPSVKKTIGIALALIIIKKAIACIAFRWLLNLNNNRLIKVQITTHCNNTPNANRCTNGSSIYASK